MLRPRCGDERRLCASDSRPSYVREETHNVSRTQTRQNHPPHIKSRGRSAGLRLNSTCAGLKAPPTRHKESPPTRPHADRTPQQPHGGVHDVCMRALAGGGGWVRALGAAGAPGRPRHHLAGSTPPPPHERARGGADGCCAVRRGEGVRTAVRQARRTALAWHRGDERPRRRTECRQRGAALTSGLVRVRFLPECLRGPGSLRLWTGAM